MSHFSAVVFFCPFCEARNEYQSMVGDCVITYRAESVPIGIAESMDRQEVVCEACGKKLRFKNVTPAPRCIIIAMAAPVK